SIDLAASLAPDRIALFGYAHVPWMKSHQRLIKESELPKETARWAQAEAAAARLEALGYLRIGLDHFARPEDPLARAVGEDRLRRNFQGYTDDPAEALIGLGASAIGSLPQGYVQNAVPIKDYRAAVAAGQPAVVRGCRLSEDDRLRRAVIETLMCRLKVDLAGLCAGFDADPADFTEEVAALDSMAADGLVEIDGDEIRVTEAGRPLVRSAAAVFDRYLKAGTARHSRAV
ncbi:MAG: coproporphyrinogen III oxidase, partial [Kiloniellales bacterium]|nr:coproporphyrinogen III oxidase [Kiloniellales bacterium]